jgi:succinyl-diaminopimelate desuccinylase
MTEAREQLARLIDAERHRLVGFLQGFARIDTANPPGDTRAGADYVARFLEAAGLPYRVIAPQPEKPNLLGSFAGAGPGRHLVLNGHIDVFPAGDTARWSRDPWSGEIVDNVPGGSVWGRGTVDMKCGTTASIFTYAFLHRFRDQLRGRLTLTVVSDEETGGRWGTGYLLDHHADEVLGDCVLNGEPSSPYTVRFGEKAWLWLVLRVRTPGAHGAYSHLSRSATKIAARLVTELVALEALTPKLPDQVARLMADAATRAAIDRGLGPGAADVASRLTVNIGVLRGGVKVNMLPGEAVIEADLRLPVGLDRHDVLAAVTKILERYPDVTMEPDASQGFNATWSDPDHPMVRIVQDNVEASLGFRPPAIVSLGGTDCRFWRARGVPAFVYGCSPDRMGAPDERVPIAEFLHTVRTHALSAFDYLAA